jgi:hypothetical protein
VQEFLPRPFASSILSSPFNKNLTVMDADQVLVTAGSAILGCMCTVHMYYTFYTRAFQPRDPQVMTAMKNATIFLTNRTSLWDAWMGFNGSHSLGGMVFAAAFARLAISHKEVLRRDKALLLLPVATGLSYLYLGRKYWFRSPIIGISLATACFAGAAAINLSQK